MTDIVERLRRSSQVGISILDDNLLQAAAEIERLRAALKRLLDAQGAFYTNQEVSEAMAEAQDALEQKESRG